MKFKCPQCFLGKIYSFHGDEICDCDLCDGTTKISFTKVVWRILGKISKWRRIKARLTLRKAAKILKIEPIELSKMERGVIAPRMFDY